MEVLEVVIVEVKPVEVLEATVSVEELSGYLSTERVFSDPCSGVPEFTSVTKGCTCAWIESLISFVIVVIGISFLAEISV